MMRSTLVTAAVLFAVYSQESPQSDACARIAPSAPMSEAGAFSNMRYTEEHAYGETVFLWRSGNCIVGLFESAQGLQGDTPIGELQDVTHNANTGELKFSAKLTLGVIAGPGTSEQPSRDLFTFDGTVGPARLTGALIHATQVDPKTARSQHCPDGLGERRGGHARIGHVRGMAGEMGTNPEAPGAEMVSGPASACSRRR